MRKLLIAIAALVALVVVVVVVAPFFIPVDWVKQRAIAQVEAATGRKLTIDGDVSLSVLPNVQVEVSDVTFANMDGSDEPNMVALKGLGLDVQLIPLLSGELVIDRFVLVDPVIRLETDASGHGNWEFSPPGGTSDGGSASTGDSTGSDGGSGGQAGLADLRLGDVHIENGTISMRDGATGEITELNGINVTLDMPALASPATAKGSLVYNGQTVNFDIGAGSPQALMQGATSTAKVSLDSSPLTASFDGEVGAGGSLAGQVDLKIPALAALAAWLGHPLDETGQVPKAVAVTGKLAKAGDTVSFTDASFTVDALSARGDLSLDMSGARPRVTAALDADMLDLNPYLPQTASEETAASSGSESGTGAGGGGQPEDWSDEPIDFSALDLVDADMTFTLAGLKVRAIEIGKSSLAIKLADGTATIDLPEAQLYGGGGTAHVVIDRSGGRPAIATTLDFAGIAAEPLLIAATGFDKLSGTGDLTMDVKTSGETERQFVHNLNGKGDFIFRDGAFKGANLAAMAREVSLDSLNSAVSPDQATDFAELSASYVIDNGVLTNDDLFMAAPLLRIDGKGNVNMPPRTLDYSIWLKPVASLEGQGASNNGGGVPILVRGPWSDPSIGPDLDALAKGLLTNPEAIGNTLENLGVDSGGVQDLLNGLGNSGDSGSGGSGDGNAVDDAKDALKSLFQ